MSAAYLEGLLRDVFAAQGATDAAGLAHKAALDFERSERRAKIYELRATMTEAAVAERFGISVSRVEQIVREETMFRQQRNRRAG